MLNMIADHKARHDELIDQKDFWTRIMLWMGDGSLTGAAEKAEGMGLRKGISETLYSAADAWLTKSAVRMTLIDAAGVAVALEEIGLRVSTQGFIQMDGAPTNASGPTVAATQGISLLQTNSTALIAERSISLMAIRSNAFANLTGVAIAAGPDSPIP
jgi:hypothetical protein